MSLICFCFAYVLCSVCVCHVQKVHLTFHFYIFWLVENSFRHISFYVVICHASVGGFVMHLVHCLCWSFVFLVLQFGLSPGLCVGGIICIMIIYWGDKLE